ARHHEKQCDSKIHDRTPSPSSLVLRRNREAAGGRYEPRVCTVFDEYLNASKFVNHFLYRHVFTRYLHPKRDYVHEQQSSAERHVVRNNLAIMMTRPWGLGWSPPRFPNPSAA